MDRTKIMNAIVEDYKRNNGKNEADLYDMIKTLSDNSLICFAISVGIDTNAVLTEVK